MGLKLVPLLATRCLYWGHWGIGGGDGVGVHLTKYQPDPQADDMLCWPAVVPLLNTRCLYWGGASKGLVGSVGRCWGIGGLHMKKMKTVYCKVLLKTQDSLLHTIEHELRWIGPKLEPLLATRCLYQQGTSELRSTRPKLVPLLATRCLYQSWARSSGPM